LKKIKIKLFLLVCLIVCGFMTLEYNYKDEQNNEPMIAFIFDDGYISHFRNSNIFESRGLLCGFAVNAAYINNSARMSFNQLKDL